SILQYRRTMTAGHFELSPIGARRAPLQLLILFRDNRPRFRWVTHEAQRIPQNPHLKFSVVWLSQRRTRLKRFWIQRTRRAGRFRFVGENGDQYRGYTLSFYSALDLDDGLMP